MSETIKVKNSYIAKVMPTIINGQVIQNPVAESLKKKRLPTLMQYWSRRALDKLPKLYRAYDETRQEIIKQHSQKDEDGELLIVMRNAAKIKPLILETMTDKVPFMPEDTPKKRKEIESINLTNALAKIDIDTDEMTKAIGNEAISPKIAEAISKWSDGKINVEGNGDVSIENMPELQNNLNDLMEEEIDLGINLIEVDLKAWEEDKRYDILSGEEMDLLWPMLEIR